MSDHVQSAQAQQGVYGEKPIERIESGIDADKGDHQNYDRIDAEVAKYASEHKIDISPEEDERLRKLIDRRVLVIMVSTYFLQAIDKGTLSFSSIMGLPKDTGMVNEKGAVTQQFNWLTTCIYLTILVVEYPQVSRESLLS